jgi:uracil-DNA glycosylase
MSLLPPHIHPTWASFLTEDVLQHIQQISEQIQGEAVNPRESWRTLRFLQNDLSEMKVVWLGQDVYPAAGVATGRAFEVGGMTSWHVPFRQVSMKNIVRLLHKNYKGIQNYEEIASFKDIQEEMLYGDFPILPPHQWFDSLEQQGVLFLNRYFTCRVGEANSHRDLWATFSDQLLTYISSNHPELTWFLWGQDAISAKALLKDGTFYMSRHPMMCSSKYEDDFLKFDGFEKTWKRVNWLGIL